MDDEEPVKAVSRITPKPAVSAKQERTVRPTSSKITPMRSNKRGTQTANMEVCVIKPASMDDTKEIADTLVDNSTVILNLEGIDVELAQRIIDFTSGACYSLGGRSRKYPATFLSLDHTMWILQEIYRIFWEAPFLLSERGIDPQWKRMSFS